MANTFSQTVLAGGYCAVLIVLYVKHYQQAPVIFKKYRRIGIDGLFA
jgi:hypothetical protein